MRRNEAGAGRGRASGGGRSRPGRLPPPWQLKTTLCNYYARGACQRGDSCWFAHGDAELQRPALLQAAGSRLTCDVAGVLSELLTKLQATLMPLAHELAASGGTAFADAQRAQAARATLAGALVLDAQEVLHRRLVGPPLDGALQNLISLAHTLWDAASRTSSSLPPPSPPGPPPLAHQQQQAQQPGFSFGASGGSLAPPLPVMPGSGYRPPLPLMPGPGGLGPTGLAPPPPPPPPPQQPQQAAGVAAGTEFQGAIGMIVRGDCVGLAQLLSWATFEEDEAASLLWEAAVDSCSAPALQVLLSKFGDMDWTEYCDEDTDEELVFCLLRKAPALGWDKIEPVLRLVVEANPAVLHSRLLDDGEKDMPLHLALSLRPPPPLQLVCLLAPPSDPAVWTAWVGGVPAEELQPFYQRPTDTPTDRVLVQDAFEYLRDLRVQQQVAQQRAIEQAAQERREREEMERMREKQLAARQAEQKAKLEAERQARLAREEAARQAKIQRQQQAEREREERRRKQEEAAAAAAAAAAAECQRQAAAAEAERKRQEAVRHALMQTREGRVELLHKAALQCSVVQVRQLWGQVQLSRQEAHDLLFTAVCQGGSWPVVRECVQRWDEERWGHWCCVEHEGDAHSQWHEPRTLIFHVLEDHRKTAKLHRDAARRADLASILQEMLRARPELATLRSPATGSIPVVDALHSGAHLDIIRVLAPRHLPDVLHTENHPAYEAGTPLELARQLARKFRANPFWHKHWLECAEYLDGLAREIERERAAKLRQLAKEFQSATEQAVAAVEKGSVEDVQAALAAVLDPRFEEARAQELPLQGLGAWFQDLMLKAPNLQVASAVEEAGKPHGMRPVADQLVAAQLLEAALQGKHFPFVTQLLKHYPAALVNMTRPPVLLALQQGAPSELLADLIPQSQELRKDKGGACEEAPGLALPPAALAIERGRLDVLSKLLELNPELEFEQPHVAQEQQQRQQQQAKQRKSKQRQQQQQDSGPQHQGSTLLYHACAAGQEDTVAAVLQSLRRRLVEPTRLAAHVNRMCDGGATALYRVVDTMPNSSLPGLLLSAGADPSIACREGRGETTAVHLAAQRGHRKLVQQLLKSLSDPQRSKVLRMTLDRGQTLLHSTIEAQDVSFVGRLVGQGAPVLTSPVSNSPLLLALALREGARSRLAEAEQALIELGGQVPQEEPREEGEEGEEGEGDEKIPAAEQPSEQAPKPHLHVAGAFLKQLLQRATGSEDKAKVQEAAKVHQKAAQAARTAAQICEELLKGWSGDSLMRLLEADLAPTQRQLASAFVEEHSATVLAPFLQGTRERKQRLLQLGLDSANTGLLSTLLAQPGMSAAAQGLNLHPAFKWLPRALLMKLVEAGSSVNLRDAEDGSLLTHKAVKDADLDLLDFLLRQPGANILAGDKNGNTLLHWSTVYTPTDKREAVMRHLLRRAPRLLVAQNISRQTAHDFARSRAPKKILTELEEELRREQPELLQEALEAAGQAGGGARKRSDPEAEEDLTHLGPKNEPEGRKRQRVEAMAQKVSEVLDALRAQQAQQAQQPAAPAGSGEAVAGGANAAAAVQLQLQPQPQPQPQQGGGEAEGLRDVVSAAVERTMPEAAERGQAEHVDDAFSDDDGAEGAGARGGTGGDAELDDAELAAAVKAAALPSDMDRLGELLAEMPWEFTITREAWHEWLGMDANFRRMVLLRLQHIGRGAWAADGKTKRLLGLPATLELWSSKLTKGGRIVFEVAADYSDASKCWCDMLRLWVITLDHKRYEEALSQIEDSHRKSQLVKDRVKLTPRPGAPSTASSTPGRGVVARERLPTDYDAEEQEGAEGEEGGQSGGRPGSRGGEGPQRLYFPPASAGHNNYTLLKFYKLSSELVHAVMEGLDESQVDFSFRVSPAEQEIIEMVPRPPRTIILLGRSGTGKTTCAVFRMWSHWLTAWHRGDTFNQVFVTASATLQDQVAKSFGKLRNAVVPQELAAAYAEAAAREYPTLLLGAVPPEAFPLFLSSRQFLRMLDGTVAEPFFPRRPDGSIMWDRSEDDFDPDGMSLRVELDAAADMELEEDEEDEEGSEDELSDDELLPVGGGGGRGQAAAGVGPTKWKRQEVTFPIFQEMWREVASKDLRARLKPGLAWLEIISYIKGSAEAVRTAEGRLSLEQYLDIGRKRAPNFTCDSRRLVHEVCEQYQRLKRQRGRYDNADVVASVFRQLRSQGYRGVPIHSLYRDEVQDFTQAELLMDLRIVSDPNGLFLCGDTAQTIARGIGFRFTDIQTLFYEERRDQLALEAASNGGAGGGGDAGAGDAAGGGGPAPEVQMPLIAHLKVNYRTHSGILEVASSVVDALKRFFPQHIDHLDRERAFFKGPKPLLLSTVTTDDLAILLSWSDKASSQVEFGAHQVVLVRSMDSIDHLPEGLRDSNALVLTVPQSKGLEFDDVFLVNFCSDSPVKDEWRVLLQYLEELEDLEALHGAAALPGKRPLLTAEAAAEGIGELGRGALRKVSFDESQHKVLCEELKHLYTAVTRAKNSVVIYDENPAARAPLYYYLARRGLARVVGKSLMEAGVDTQDLGITKTRSTPSDWAAQGYNLLEKGVFDAAARCFERAGDAARAQYCVLRGRMSKARQQQETSPHEAKAAWFAAAYELLALAVNSQPNPALLPPAPPSAGTKRGQEGVSLADERRLWVALSAKAFQQAGERELAVRMWLALGSYKQARELLSSMGDLQRLADCYLAAADALKRQGQAGRAVPWLAAAVKQLRTLGQWGRCLAILEGDDAVRKKLQRSSPAVLQDIGVNAMREIAASSSGSTATAGRGSTVGSSGGAAQQQQQQQRLVAAARLIHNPALRAERLEHFGCYAELAKEVKDPLRAGQLLAEHASYPSAVARLLEAAVETRLPSAALRLLHRLVAAAGSPTAVASTWRLLQQAEAAGGSASLVAELPRMRADLAARLAHQLAGLHPLTSAPLPAAAAAAAEGGNGGDSISSGGGSSEDQAASAALTAAQLVAASLPEAEDTDHSAADLAARLACYAQQAYHSAGQALGELRCLAVLAALRDGAQVPADSLQRGMHLAELLLGRWGVAAAMNGVRGWRGRRPTAEERWGLQQIEELFHLTGLADPAGAAAHGGGVTCPRSDPGLRALAELFSTGAAQHGTKDGLRTERRKLAPAARQPGGAGSAELLAADQAAVEKAAAFYLLQLATAATSGLLSSGGQAGSGVGSALAPPPGLAPARPTGFRSPAVKALEDLGRRFRALDYLKRVQAEARKVFPQLRLAAGKAASDAGESSLVQREAGLVEELLHAVFPSGRVDALPAALDIRRLLLKDGNQLEALLRSRYWQQSAPHAYSPNPDVGFELWRSLTFILARNKRPYAEFRKAAGMAVQEPKGSAERKLLIHIRGRLEVPAMLLVEATDSLQQGFASHAVEAMLFYLERCLASASSAAPASSAAACAAGTATSSSDTGSRSAGAQQKQKQKKQQQQQRQAMPALGAEKATWLLELLCGLACVSCVRPKQGVAGAAYLPRAAADMLTQLPFLAGRDGGIRFEHLADAEKADHDKQHALWRRLASVLAATMRSLAAQAAAGAESASTGSGISSTGAAVSSCTAMVAGGGESAAAATASARALLGRLALAAGSVLSSLAVRHQGSKDLPAELPGALYAALQAADPLLPELGLEGIERARRVGDLLGALHEAAKGQGTAVIQVSDQNMREFDGLPKLPDAAAGSKGPRAEEDDIDNILAELDGTAGSSAGGKGGKKKAHSKKQQQKQQQQQQQQAKVDPAQAKLLQLAALPVAFREPGLRAAPTSVQLPALDDLEEYQPKEEPAVRRAKAALVIQHAWRAYKRAQALQAAMAVFQKPFFRSKVRAWLGELKERRRQEEQEEAAKQEQERLRAAALADAANAEARYDWVEAVLGRGMLSAAECPICRHEAPRAGEGGAPSSPALPAGLASPATGAGLSAAAPSFLPHLFTDSHRCQADAFQQYVQRYRDDMAPALLQTRELGERLGGIVQGPYYAAALQHNAELGAKLQEAHSVLSTYDTRRHWDETEQLREAAEKLAAACARSMTWLDSHAAAAAQQSSLAEHEREAAELQQAMLAAAAQQGGGEEGEDGGWSVVGRGGQARRAMDALDEELRDEEIEDEFGTSNIYDLLDEAEDGASKGKRRRGRGGKNKKKGGGGGNSRHGSGAPKKAGA